MSKRVTFTIGPNSAAALARMEALTGEDTKYVVQNALSLYLWFTEAEERGQQVLLRDPKSGVTSIHVFESINES